VPRAIQEDDVLRKWRLYNQKFDEKALVQLTLTLSAVVDTGMWWEGSIAIESRDSIFSFSSVAQNQNGFSKSARVCYSSGPR
jgi:hypothetical protein